MADPATGGRCNRLAWAETDQVTATQEAGAHTYAFRAPLHLHLAPGRVQMGRDPGGGDRRHGYAGGKIVHAAAVEGPAKAVDEVRVRPIESRTGQPAGPAPTSVHGR